MILYDITLSVVLFTAVAFFIWAMALHVKHFRRGEGPNDDPNRKPFLDSKGNHCYYDRELMQ